MPRSESRPPRRGVQLREVEEANLSVFFEQQLDPESNRMAAFTARDPTDRGAFDAHWRKILGDKNVTLVTIVSDGRVAGYVGKFEERPGKPEVMYWIGTEYRGQGLATKALSEFLSLLTTRPIYARAARDNVASLRVLEKCGFVISGYERSFAKPEAGKSRRRAWN